MKMDDDHSCIEEGIESLKYDLRRLIIFPVILVLTLAACQGDAQPEFTPQAVTAADCNYGGIIKSVEALDETTVKFTLCNSDPAFAAKIANPAFSITDDVYLNEMGGDAKKMSANPVGTGPYRVKEYKPGAYLILEANPVYWGTPLQSKTVNLTWSKDLTRRFNSLDLGSVNVVDLIPPTNFDTIRSSPDLAMQFRPSLNTLYLGFNNEIPPFENESIRKAIGIGLTRDALIRPLNPYATTFADQKLPVPEGSLLADQLIPFTLYPGNTAGFTWYPQDTQKAIGLISDTKYAGGVPATLYYPELDDPSLPNMALVAEAIKNQLAQIGIDLTVTGMNPEQFKVERDLGNLGFYLNLMTADFADASSFYDANFTSDSKALGRHYADILIEINSAEKESDPAARQVHYDRVNQLIKDHVPIIPIAFPATAVANNRNVENVTIGPLNENITEITTPTGAINFMQSTEPSSLWPADEDSKDTFRVASLLYDTLLTYDYGTTDLKPSLADTWFSNDDLTEWTFQLRYGPEFSNGSKLDANDVVASFAAMWDASNPNHKGNSGQFALFKRFFGNFINR
jgi:ABC-type transport system substrate-binding protein